MNASGVEATKNVVFNGSKLSVLHWGPVIDGVSTIASPQELIRAKKYNKDVPVILGSVRDEWAMFSNIILRDRYGATVV